MSIQPNNPPEDTSGPEMETYALLRQINAVMETYHRYDLRSEDITIPQFMILNYASIEGVPLSEISARMFCDNSNLTGIVDRLIAKGFVERRADPNDRRISRICLTPKGAEKLQNLRPRHHAQISRRMQALSPAQVNQLRNLLSELFEGLNDPNEGQ
jgi:MarR family 2-MHQ and catechol resistance regulon transcriptional repressor